MKREMFGQQTQRRNRATTSYLDANRRQHIETCQTLDPDVREAQAVGVIGQIADPRLLQLVSKNVEAAGAARIIGIEVGQEDIRGQEVTVKERNGA